MQFGLWRAAEDKKWPQSAETVDSSPGRRTLGDSSGNRVTTEFVLTEEDSRSMGPASMPRVASGPSLAAAPTGGSGKGVRE
jgi:hypothetical protein